MDQSPEATGGQARRLHHPGHGLQEPWQGDKSGKRRHRAIMKDRTNDLPMRGEGIETPHQHLEKAIAGCFVGVRRTTGQHLGVYPFKKTVKDGRLAGKYRFKLGQAETGGGGD